MTLALVSVLLLLAVVAIAARIQMLAGSEISHSMRQSNRVIESGQKVLNDLLDAESAQRGFVVTGREEYLRPYEAGSREAVRHLDRLRRLVAAKPQQAERVDRLASLARERLDVLGRGIELRRTQGFQAAQAIIATDIGKRAMDSIREQLAALDTEERRLLDLRNAEQARHRTRLRALLVFLGLGAVAALVLQLLILNTTVRRRSHAERSRRESEERLAVILRSIGDAVIATNRAGEVVFVNPVAERLTGWPEREAHGRALEQVFRIIDSKTRTVAENPVSKALRTGAAFDLGDTAVLITRSGTELPIDDSGAPIRDEAGNVSGVVLVFRDASERRVRDAERERLMVAEAARVEAERFAEQLQKQAAELERASRRTRALEEANIVGIVYADGTRIVRANDAFLNALGYTRQDVDAGLLEWTAITPQEYFERDDRARQEMRERGECAPYEKEFWRKDGSRVPMLIGAAIVRRDPTEAICVAVDLTSEKAIEEDRERLLAETHAANVAKDEFLAVLSHELRSPLSAILGWVAVLKRGVGAPEDFARAVEAIERNVHLQTNLVNDLLDVSRIISGKLLMERKAVSFAMVAQRATENLRGAMQAKGLRLEARFGDLPATVLGDEKRLEQMVQNLLTNAVKFTPAGGRIEVDLAVCGNEVRLQVADSGEGIDAPFLPHLFERFRQANATRVRRHGGLGLGLSIVKHLTDLHGGRVEAESAGPGSGSVFRIILPLAAREAAPVGRRIERADEEGLGGIKILLVDDEEDTREALRLILENRGANVRTAASAAEGMQALCVQLPDVIVSDVAMPEEDGYEFLRRVRARWGDEVAAVAVTGFASVEDRDAALRAGFNDHVVKPLDLDLLVTKIRQSARGKNRPSTAAEMS